MLKGKQYLSFLRCLKPIINACQVDPNTPDSNGIAAINGYSSHTQGKIYCYDKLEVLNHRQEIRDLIELLEYTPVDNKSGIIGILPYQNLLKEAANGSPDLESTQFADHFLNLMTIALIGFPIKRTDQHITAGGIFMLDPQLTERELIDKFGTNFLTLHNNTLNREPADD